MEMIKDDRAERTIRRTALIMPRAGRNEVCGSFPILSNRRGVKGRETETEHREPKCSGISTYLTRLGSPNQIKKTTTFIYPYHIDYYR